MDFPSNYIIIDPTDSLVVGGRGRGREREGERGRERGERERSKNRGMEQRVRDTTNK